MVVFAVRVERWIQADEVNIVVVKFCHYVKAVAVVESVEVGVMVIVQDSANLDNDGKIRHTYMFLIATSLKPL